MMVNLDYSLTVEDSDHEKNSTVANITVLQMPDYPPVANAGQDVIIYLPHHNVTLNGNLSSDDKAIVSWEWTKSPSDQDKAVDMQVFVMFMSTFYLAVCCNFVKSFRFPTLLSQMAGLKDQKGFSKQPSLTFLAV